MSILSLSLFGLVAAASSPESSELTVYTARKDHLIKPVFDRYTEETGVKIRYRTDKAPALLQQLITEGDKTEADILMTVDAGNLWKATDEEVLTSSPSEVLSNNIPAHLRDPQDRWFGFSLRARTIFYNPENVNPEELSTYKDLASDKWKGRLCLRTSKKVYNQSLVSAMINHYGEEQTEETIRGWVANLATQPFSNDTSMLEAVDKGQCDVGIANSYYFGRLQKKNPDINVKIFWTNQDSFGTHINVSGAGIVKASDQKEQALRFLEWLSKREAQSLFARLNLEFPANPQFEADSLVKSWGSFQQDKLNLRKVGELQATAVQLMDRAEYK